MWMTFSEHVQHGWLMRSDFWFSSTSLSDWPLLMCWYGVSLSLLLPLSHCLSLSVVIDVLNALPLEGKTFWFSTWFKKNFIELVTKRWSGLLLSSCMQSYSPYFSSSCFLCWEVGAKEVYLWFSKLITSNWWLAFYLLSIDSKTG